MQNLTNADIIAIKTLHPTEIGEFLTRKGVQSLRQAVEMWLSENYTSPESATNLINKATDVPISHDKYGE